MTRRSRPARRVHEQANAENSGRTGDFGDCGTELERVRQRNHRELQGDEKLPIIHLFRTSFFRRLNSPNRPQYAPVGSRSIWLLSAMTAALPALCRAISSLTRGESYVFDRGWAEAYENAGGSYYPKLQASVPFTPATGPRLLVKPASVDAIRFAVWTAARFVFVNSAASAKSFICPRHLHLHEAEMSKPRGGSRFSCCAQTSSSTGKMPATRPSTIF